MHADSYDVVKSVWVVDGGDELVVRLCTFCILQSSDYVHIVKWCTMLTLYRGNTTHNF